MSFASTWMDLAIIMLSEVSHWKTNAYMQDLKTNEVIYTTEINSQKLKQTYGYQSRCEKVKWKC